MQFQENLHLRIVQVSVVCFFQEMAGLDEVEPTEIDFSFSSLGTEEYLAY